MTVVVIVIVGFFIWQLKAKNRFDRLRAQVSQVTLSKVSMDEAGETLLATVKGAWKLQTQEVPDSVFSEIASMTGLPESVAGVAEFFTHEIPEFFFRFHKMPMKLSWLSLWQLRYRLRWMANFINRRMYASLK